MSFAGKLSVALGMCLLAYLPFLAIPLISDDYIQITLARQYGPISAWSDLARDVLYRCRATSLMVTFALDSLFGPDATLHRLVNLFLHFANVALVMLLGAWGRIGWRVSVPAGMFFAVHEGHQEAVVWTAAMPELLVFLFDVGSCWLWMRGQRALALAAFVLALFSKESAVVVVPLIAWFWWREQKLDRAGLPWVGAMGALAVIYTGLIFAVGDSHLHLNDAGTFSVTAPFARTLAISAARLLWFWGFLAIALLLVWRARRDLVLVALGWMVVTLLPYSFLTYMDRVPSRHTYLASAGLALLVGAAFTVCQDRLKLGAPWVAAALALAMVGHNVGYLWVKKLRQFQERADITERFLDEAGRHDKPIAIECGAYPVEIYKAAVVVRLGGRDERVLGGGARAAEGAVSYCDPFHP